MTNEERIRGLEDAVMNLSNILEARGGAYGRELSGNVPIYGAQIHQWVAAVRAHRDEA
jgi:hypothetical protein